MNCHSNLSLISMHVSYVKLGVRVSIQPARWKYISVVPLFSLPDTVGLLRYFRGCRASGTAVGSEEQYSVSCCQNIHQRSVARCQSVSPRTSTTLNVACVWSLDLSLKPPAVCVDGCRLAEQRGTQLRYDPWVINFSWHISSTDAPSKHYTLRHTFNSRECTPLTASPHRLVIPVVGGLFLDRSYSP